MVHARGVSVFLGIMLGLSSIVFIPSQAKNLSVPMSANQISSVQGTSKIELKPHSKANEHALSRGEVVLRTQDVGANKYMVGTIIIERPAEEVWPIIVNPYEYKHAIFPRVRKIDVLVDEPNFSRVKASINCFPFPDIGYTVESFYQPCSRVEFKRIEGCFKNFAGNWSIKPTANGSACEVTFSMLVEPEFFLPQWLVRQGIKIELPKTLTALRNRVDAISKAEAKLETQSILAADSKNNS
jgi:ribosome-associated toxin RatA of RatAB toxin-antitoxin module